MGERGSRKIPVTERQFLWVQDDDKGEVILHVGPTMVSPTAADRVVVDDGAGGFKEDNSGRPQKMVELSDSQYAVLHNPLAAFHENEGANGNFRPGRNESRSLHNGTRNMIPGPMSFYLRPGQRAEVRDAHELASNQYLVVKVYGEVDTTAPYYGITARSAAIVAATAEDVESHTSSALSGETVGLTRGQLIVIRGLDTQFYIPPTGVDVVPDLSVDDAGTVLDAKTAREIMSQFKSEEAEVEVPEPVQQMDFYDEDDEFEEYPSRKGKARRKEKKADRFGGVEQAARARHRVQRQAVAPPPAPQMAMSVAPMAPPPPEPVVSSHDVEALLSSAVHREALMREARKARLVREAVVLSEKEFCVVIDADGKREIKVGPARVFPGPYDSFMTKGSTNRIYNAYELLPQRALWLRFVSQISRERLAQQLPRGVELDRDIYLPGDEMIITGLNTFFFPFVEIEILHPLTGQPHFGNDHADVFIEAIGLDQKSGIYVRDLATGEVRLVRGKQSYLVDPRKEVHITRNVSTQDWNLWISPGEPHKRTQRPITTPWAISINVPHNTAVLAASAEGQRVIQGPCVELLEYDERLVSLSLSTGTPKDDSKALQTCYLRTMGNVVSDVIRVETSDFVEVDLRVSYRISFDKEEAHVLSWFNHENYVGMVCDHLRSLVRRHCRQLTLTDLWPRIPDVVRDIILGAKKEGAKRGRFFEENGLWVVEVEILESQILDEEIGEYLENVQRESVSLQISDRQASEKLRSEKLRHEIDLERMGMRQIARERQAELEARIRELEHSARMSDISNKEYAATKAAALTAEREAQTLHAKLERDKESLSAGLERIQRESVVKGDALKLDHEESERHRKTLSDIEAMLLDAKARATVAEREAIQPALVEALTGLGDKVVLGEVAQNMNLVSLFKGKDVASLFAEILGGTKLSETIETMLPKEPKKKR